jgi:uncharacterized protein YndB with AHSA1/START domain
MEDNKITIQSTINAPIEKVWQYWNDPQHIKGWAFASDTWEAPTSENDLRTGGSFKTRMQEKGTKNGFDFGGVYTNVVDHKTIEYDMSKEANDPNARHVKIGFEQTPEGVKITQSFDPENENSIEMQR